MISSRVAGRSAPAVVGLILTLLGVLGVAEARFRATEPIPGDISASVDMYLNAVRDDPGRLEEFMADLPKDGDLHSHLSGAVPTDTLIGLAAGDRLCIDSTTYVATPPPCGKGQRPAAEAAGDGPFHDRVISAWSMAGFSGSGV